MKKIVFIICLVILGFLSGCSNSTSKKLDGYITEFNKTNDNKFNGTILVTEEDTILLKKGYGMANNEEHVANKPDTIFKIASITKQFTSMGIMMLQERELLDVNDSIDLYFPNYPNGDKITIHNLLTHTSGISDYVIDLERLKSSEYYSPDSIVSLFKDEPLQYIPGQEYHYCNSNYILLGLIIEKVSGIDYESFINENIFIPLDMTNSGYYHSYTSYENEATGYKVINSNFIIADNINMSLPYAAGSLYSTVEDLYKWDKALYTDELVSKETLDIMFTPFLSNYGYGWWIENNDKNQLGFMYHYGGIFGFRNVIYRDIDKKRTVIILNNNESLDINGLLNGLISKLDKLEK